MIHNFVLTTDDEVGLLISIQRDFGSDRRDQLPHHSRMHHFSAGNRDRLQPLLDQWTQQGCDARETTRRVVDLLFVSVLLDAGAGDVWKYEEPETGQTFVRSEGIAVASIRMFTSGMFQSRNEIPHSVDGMSPYKTASTCLLSTDIWNP